MSGSGLGQFDILGLVVEIGQDGGTETDGGYALREAGFPLNPLTHPADLGIRKGLVSAEEKFTVCVQLLEVGKGQSRQANGPVAAAGLGVLDLRQITGGVGHSPTNVDGHMLPVNVLRLES